MSRRDPASAIVPLAKADADLTTGVTRALWVGTAGTVNVMDEGGAIRTAFPLIVGLNPIRIRQLRTGGTADDIWGLY